MNATDCLHREPAPEPEPGSARPPVSDHLPTLRKMGREFARITRIPRRIFLSKTSFKVYLVTASTLCLTHVGLRWHGARMIRAEQQRAASLGIATTWKELEHPMPADADNFFKAPPFAGLFEPPYPEAPQLTLWLGWRLKHETKPDSALRERMYSDPTLADACAYFRSIGTLPEDSAKLSPAQALATDSRFVPVIQSIYEAAKRPEARGPVVISEDYLPPSRVNLMRMALGIQFYATANLELGNQSQALPAFRVFRLLAKATGIGTFGRETYLDCQRQLLLTGMRTHRIPEETLRSILTENYPEAMRKAVRRGMEISRLRFVLGAQEYRPNWNILPLSDPWRETVSRLIRDFTTPYTLARDTVRTSRDVSAKMLVSGPLEPGETWASRKAQLDGRIQTQHPPWFGDSSQQLQFSWVVIRPVLTGTLHHVAAALELHWLKYGRYPVTLAGLDSGLPETALRDGDGQPFAYTTDAEGAHFSLSAGKDIKGWSTMPEMSEVPGK